MARLCHKFRGLLLMALIAAALMPVAAAADCADLLGQFNSALAARNLSAVEQIEARIAVDAQCGSRLTEVQRRRSALELLIAQQTLGTTRSERKYELLVEDADRPDVFWRAAVALGELRFKQRRFALAARAYERAVEIINDQSKTPQSPSVAAIKEVKGLADEARLLAANEDNPVAPAVFVGAPRTRAGTVGGTMSVSIRGFEPKVVPMPIRFVTASVEFTDVGTQAANELLTALREQKPDQITLVGHTDERGGAAYNMRLSAHRAQAVAHFLKRNGITTRIITVAKGKTEPLELYDTTGLTQQDIWALNRRVDWKRD